MNTTFSSVGTFEPTSSSSVPFSISTSLFFIFVPILTFEHALKTLSRKRLAHCQKPYGTLSPAESAPTNRYLCKKALLHRSQAETVERVFLP
jgi:hypothetical protein